MLNNGQYPNAFLLSLIVAFQGKEYERGLLGDLGELPLYRRSK